jgi:hypothetical protein
MISPYTSARSAIDGSNTLGSKIRTQGIGQPKHDGDSRKSPKLYFSPDSGLVYGLESAARFRPRSRAVAAFSGHRRSRAG